MRKTAFRKSISKFVLAIAVLSMFLPVRVLACACCAEPGVHFEHESDFSDYVLEEVEKISLASSILYTDAGFPESIKGIEPLGNEYEITGTLKGEVWTLEFSDDKARKAVLSLWRPSRVLEFGVDQNPLEEGANVVLYKEMRFKYRVQSATGFLKDGIDAETTFNLVLQGRGNGCTNASDFSTYILQIKGNKADYSFFGKLSTAEDPIMQRFADEAGITVAH